MVRQALRDNFAQPQPIHRKRHPKYYPKHHPKRRVRNPTARADDDDTDALAQRERAGRDRTDDADADALAAYDARVRPCVSVRYDAGVRAVGAGAVRAAAAGGRRWCAAWRGGDGRGDAGRCWERARSVDRRLGREWRRVVSC